MIQLVPAKLTHVGPIASNMREIDRLEAKAMGRTPKDALRIGLRTSLSSLTALEDGKPIAMLGCVAESLIEGRGILWMLGTDAVFRNGRGLLTIAPPVLAEWQAIFPVMGNLIAVCNHCAIRLLIRWGATVGGEVQTIGGVEFIPFRFERSIQGGEAVP